MVTYLSVTSVRIRLTVFTTCASLTQTKIPICRILQRSVCRRQREQRSECTLRHDSKSVDTPPPFVTSVDELLGVEAMTTLNMIDSLLATKWWQPYSHTCG